MDSHSLLRAWLPKYGLWMRAVPIGTPNNGVYYGTSRYQDKDSVTTRRNKGGN